MARSSDTELSAFSRKLMGGILFGKERETSMEEEQVHISTEEKDNLLRSTRKVKRYKVGERGTIQGDVGDDQDDAYTGKPHGPASEAFV